MKFAQQHAPVLGGNYFCPCVNCVNGRRHSLEVIRSHIICDGFRRSYTNWIWHGEQPKMSTTADTEPVHVQTEDRMEDMIRDLGHESFLQAQAPYYEKLEIDSKLPLYLGCTTFTRLSMVLALVNLKARFGWSDKTMTELLVDMAMEWGGDGYCLPNPRPRLPNMSLYPYPIPNRFKIFISSPYPSGIGYPQPRPVPDSN